MTKYQIAKEVRKRAEEYASKNKIDQSLCGMCAIASSALSESFRNFGYDAKLVKGYYKEDLSHCWVISDDKIWDITATQFDFKTKIKTFDVDDERYDDENNCFINSIRQFKGWPKEQRPFTKRTKKLVISKKED